MSQTWIKVALVTDIDEGDTRQVEAGGEEICLYKLEGQVYATQDVCTHGRASMAEGQIVDGGLIECPLHEGTFDIRTGAAVGAPCKRALKCYPVRVEGDAVQIGIAD